MLGKLGWFKELWRGILFVRQEDVLGWLSCGGMRHLTAIGCDEGLVFFSFAVENSIVLPPSTNSRPCLLLRRVRLLEFGSN